MNEQNEAAKVPLFEDLPAILRRMAEETWEPFGFDSRQHKRPQAERVLLVAAADQHTALTAKCAELEAEVKRLREALTAAQGLIAHSPGCNERYYGRDQTCCCGFYECKRDIRAALTPPNNKEQP